MNKDNQIEILSKAFWNDNTILCDIMCYVMKNKIDLPSEIEKMLMTIDIEKGGIRNQALEICDKLGLNKTVEGAAVEFDVPNKLNEIITPDSISDESVKRINRWTKENITNNKHQFKKPVFSNPEEGSKFEGFSDNGDGVMNKVKFSSKPTNNHVMVFKQKGTQKPLKNLSNTIAINSNQKRKQNTNQDYKNNTTKDCEHITIIGKCNYKLSPNYIRYCVSMCDYYQ